MVGNVGIHARPLRILHVVGRMNRGGTETWLMHVLRHIDSSRFQMDFLAHHSQPGDFDAEIHARGSILHQGISQRHLLRYGKVIKGILSGTPGYDIVHCHLNAFSGPILKYADQLGIPIRIAHCHNDVIRIPAGLNALKRAYAVRSRRLIARYATHGLACSETAAASLFGRQWRTDPRRRVLYCGIDLAPFSRCESKQQIRDEFGIPHDAFVIGHVGRFHEQKNHRLIVEIAQTLARQEKKFHMVLVGDGPLRRHIQEEVHRNGLGTRVTFAGIRPDVPRLLSSLFDVFLFPSLYEGLGLAAVESLAAGCPVVMSDVVPPEADVVPQLVTRLPLSSLPNVWAERLIHRACEIRTESERAAALEAVRSSPLNIVKSVSDLTSLYLQASRAASSGETVNNTNVLARCA